MIVKNLLLASAALLAVGGVARAADLPVATPVEYVKICNAFGAGYFYIPGSDTCVHIGGFIHVDETYTTTPRAYATWLRPVAAPHGHAMKMPPFVSSDAPVM